MLVCFPLFVWLCSRATRLPRTSVGQQSELLSRLFVVTKRDFSIPKGRLISDLSCINQFILYLLRFWMVSVAKVSLTCIREGAWLMVLDLTDSYRHVPVHRRDGSSLSK